MHPACPALMRHLRGGAISDTAVFLVSSLVPLVIVLCHRLVRMRVTDGLASQIDRDPDL